MKNRYRIILLGLAAMVFAGGFLTDSSAQKMSRSFQHGTSAHKKNCNSCHTVPTANSATAKGYGYPDVADYPGHRSCTGCHTRDFFTGNPPAICGGCHINPGPRGVARLSFPNVRHAHQFSTIFPHNVHQNLIASNERGDGTAAAHFINAAFSSGDETKKLVINSCQSCHSNMTKAPGFGARKIRDLTALSDPVADVFAAGEEIKAGFFKDSPSGHRSCFTCHYQNQKPNRNDCAGCHSLTSAYTATNTVKRYSLRFSHDSKNHTTIDCVNCHIRIVQNADVSKMKDADVPVFACVSCHNHSDELTEELNKRGEKGEANYQPAFQCVKCHSSAVGRFETPPSHKIPGYRK